MWGNIRKLTEAGFFKQNKHLYTDKIIADTADNLKTLIKTLSSGKARVFILHDTGDSELGYQHLVPYINKNGEVAKSALNHFEWIPKIFDGDRKDVRPYFDIDLTSESSEDHYILEHLVKVILSTTDTIVVKKEGASASSTEYVFAFNQYGFLEPNQIFSGEGPNDFYGSYEYSNYQMRLERKTNTFKGKVRNWFNYLGWSYGGAAEGTDFMNYLSYTLDVGNDDYCRYLRKFL